MYSYLAWSQQSLHRRRQQYSPRRESKLISLVTSAYNTPVDYLRVLADSIVRQDFGRDGSVEWVLVDNGSTHQDTIKELRRLVPYPFVRLFRVQQNLGIMGGMRYGVARAYGRYVVPVDSDDYLYPDAVRIMASYIQEHNYPALLYSDEDKVEGDVFFEPYLKPGWDPVLFFHSSYIAHLGAVDRGLAAMLGSYSDDRSRGCHDWDTFMRFMLVGYEPVHVPEVLYSWRRHEGSCAGNIDSKNYIHTSHQNTLRRFLDASPHSERYTLEYSPLFSRTPDWRIVRCGGDAPPLLNVALAGRGEPLNEKGAGSADDPVVIRYDCPVGTFRDMLREHDLGLGIIRLFAAEAEALFHDWFSESLTFFELFRDTVMVGGPVYHPAGYTQTAGMYFGFDGSCGSPDRLRAQGDPGYFAQMWKPHSVSAVPVQHAVIDSGFLADALFSGQIPDSVPLPCLGPWLGAVAARWEKRIVYSPFLAVRMSEDWQAWWSEEERNRFVRAHQELIPDTRFYSRRLGLTTESAYTPVPADDRTLQLSSPYSPLARLGAQA